VSRWTDGWMADSNFAFVLGAFARVAVVVAGGGVWRRRCWRRRRRRRHTRRVDAHVRGNREFAGQKRTSLGSLTGWWGPVAPSGRPRGRVPPAPTPGPRSARGADATSGPLGHPEAELAAVLRPDAASPPASVERQASWGHRRAPASRGARTWCSGSVDRMCVQRRQRTALSSAD
jgi:hypothetical protein